MILLKNIKKRFSFFWASKKVDFQTFPTIILLIFRSIASFKRMNHPNASIKFFIGVCFLNTLVLFSQSAKDNAVHEIYDALVNRENTALYNGPEFTDQFLNSWDESHIYLNTSAFTYNSLVYNNQLYSNVPLKYDLLGDNIVIRSDDYLSIFEIKLIPENISRFTANNRDFIRLTDAPPNLDGHGFFEIASIGNTLSLYIKHVKKKKRETINNVLQYSLIEDNYYLLLYNDVYHIIGSVKDFKKVVPERYKEIRNFQKDYRLLYKTDRNDFMIKLIKYLDGR